MLKTIEAKTLSATGCRFAIVAARYNKRYVEAMLRAAKKVLKEAQAAEVQVVRVPGAFEIPVVAARLTDDEFLPIDAVICLGVILRGETAHADHIGRGVTDALVRLQVATGTPMIHEVLLLENEEQAKARCLDKEHNRGREAAQSAVEMAVVLRKLQTAEDKRIAALPPWDDDDDDDEDDDCPF